MLCRRLALLSGFVSCWLPVYSCSRHALDAFALVGNWASRGWIFCQQTLQWLARYRVKPPDAFWPGSARMSSAEQCRPATPPRGPRLDRPWRLVLSQECLCGLAWFLRRWGIFFPRHCAGCAVAIRSGWLCGDCSDSLIAVAPRAAKPVRDPIPDRLSRSSVPTVEGRHFISGMRWR